MTQHVDSLRHREELMTAAQFELLGPTEAEQLLRARFETLAEWGCPVDEALVIASHVQVDIVEAIGLLRRECPPRLILRLLG
jgi:hypothetical protein